MSWNYRVGTKEVQYSEDMAKAVGEKGYRVFSIIECYYDKKGERNSYGEPKNLTHFESPEELKKSHKLIAGAFDKPILDLDNFPQIYKKNKKKK